MLGSGATLLHKETALSRCQQDGWPGSCTQEVKVKGDEDERRRQKKTKDEEDKGEDDRGRRQRKGNTKKTEDDQDGVRRRRQRRRRTKRPKTKKKKTKDEEEQTKNNVKTEVRCEEMAVGTKHDKTLAPNFADLVLKGMRRNQQHARKRCHTIT